MQLIPILLQFVAASLRAVVIAIIRQRVTAAVKDIFTSQKIPAAGGFSVVDKERLKSSTDDSTLRELVDKTFSNVTKSDIPDDSTRKEVNKAFYEIRTNGAKVDEMIYRLRRAMHAAPLSLMQTTDPMQLELMIAGLLAEPVEYGDLAHFMNPVRLMFDPRARTFDKAPTAVTIVRE